MQENSQQSESKFNFDNFEIWMSQHPERFAMRRNMTRRLMFGAAALVCILIVIWPDFIPLLPIWMIRTVAVIGTLIFAMLSYTEGEEWYNLQSGGAVRLRTTKLFDNATVKRSQILEAFDKHDFNFLLDAQDASNQPIQLKIYEDTVGKVLYLMVFKYFSSSDLRPITDVMIVEGQEYDHWAGVIRSIKSTN